VLVSCPALPWLISTLNFGELTPSFSVNFVSGLLFVSFCLWIFYLLTMAKSKKSFEEIAELKNIKADTVSALKALDYDSVAAVTTLLPFEVSALTISPAQKGLMRAWVQELNSKVKQTATKTAAEQLGC
jgi:hypothetical protein